MKKKKMGRPLIELDWNKIAAMCKIQCTQEEIAAIYECTIDTLNNQCKKFFNMTFLEFCKEKREDGKASIRRMQYKAAEAGNSALLIWLGKNYLDQSDKSEIKQSITELPKIIVELEKTNE
jgi:hypothetical protein